MTNIDALSTLKRMAEALSGSAGKISIRLDPALGALGAEFCVEITRSGEGLRYKTGRHTNLREAIDQALTHLETTC